MEETVDFFLQFKKFKDNTNSYWQKLRNEEHFADVTLACADNKVTAHKVVLSASSPVLENILINNPHPNPLIYLKGVTYVELVHLLNFMYMGEISIRKDQLNDFLAVANDLKIKGLSSESKKEYYELNYEDTGKTSTRKRKGDVDKISEINKDLCNDTEVYSVVDLDDIEMKNDFVAFDKYDETIKFDSKQNSLNKKDNRTNRNENMFPQNIEKIPPRKIKSEGYKLSSYNKENSLCNDSNIDSILRPDNISHKYNELKSVHGYTKKEENTDTKNKKNINESISQVIPITPTVEIDSLYQNTEGNIPCTNTEKDLIVLSHKNETKKENIQSISTNLDKPTKLVDDETEKDRVESNKYADVETNKNQNCVQESIQNYNKDTKVVSIEDVMCNLCDFKIKDKNELRLHRQSVHKNYYFCEMCDWNASNKSRLKSHKLAIHKDSRHQCAQCDYKSGEISNFRRHKRTKHGEGGLWYFCQDCDYTSGDKATLKKHRYSIHEGICHPCGQCDYKARQMPHLKRHILNIHGK